MNVNKNLKYNSNSVARLFHNGLAKKLLYNNHNIFKDADSFSTINDNWSYNIDATNEIVSNIANATKPYAYNTSDSKWYVKNNLGNYEQWGLMPTVSDLNNVTTYTGKLVVLSTDSHEYKWNGTQWVDLGGYVQRLVALTCDTDVSSGKELPSFKLTNNGTDFIITGTLHDTEINVKFEKTLSEISIPDVFNHCLFSSITLGDRYEYESFVALSNLYFDTGGPSKRDIIDGNIFSANVQYNIKYTNDHYLGQLLGNSNMTIFVDNVVKATRTKSNVGNSNSSIYITSPYVDIYEMKIYDDNGLIYDLKPAKLLDDSLTLYDSVNGIYATWLQSQGNLKGIYEWTIPEEYPSKPAPTLSLTKDSYLTALNGSYLNGQTVSVYGNMYNILNEHFVPVPLTPYLKGTTTSSKWLTDYVPNTNTEIEIKVLRETRVSSWTAITCAVSQTQRFNILLNTNGNNIGYGCGTQVNDTASGFSPNTVYTLKLNKDHFYVNNLVIDSFNLTITTITNPLSIGGPNGSGIGSNDNCFQGKIYYLKIWENGTLVRNYQPQPNLTFKDSVTGHTASLIGSAEYGTELQN